MSKFHETLSDGSVYMRYFSLLSLSSRVAHERLVRICFVDYDRVMDCLDCHNRPAHVSELPESAVGQANVARTNQRRSSLY
jgi:hypothetical protein